MSNNSIMKNLTEFEQHRENPFLPNAVENIQIKKRTQRITPKGRNAVHYVMNSETGEVDGYSAFLRVVEVDEERFAKLYLAELMSLWELSKPAMRVFTYIASVLVPNKDKFFFDMEECLEYTGYKNHRSIFLGLSQLIEHGVIARTTKHWQYFINPMIVFNGNRVTFAKTYVKKQREENPNQIDMFKNVDRNELIERHLPQINQEKE